MEPTADKVRITVTIDRTMADKVAELARRTNLSPSKMASMLLEEGVRDNEWIIKIVTSKLVTRVMEMFQAPASPQEAESNGSASAA